MTFLINFVVLSTVYICFVWSSLASDTQQCLNNPQQAQRGGSGGVSGGSMRCKITRGPVRASFGERRRPRLAAGPHSSPLPLGRHQTPAIQRGARDVHLARGQSTLGLPPWKEVWSYLPCRNLRLGEMNPAVLQRTGVNIFLLAIA